MGKVQPSNEIDLIQLIETVWSGKWTIIGIATAFVVSVFGFQALQPAPSFKANTLVKPIIANVADEYRQLNALDFFNVYRDVEAKNQAELSANTRAIINQGIFEKNVIHIENENKDVPSVVLNKLFFEQLNNLPLLVSILDKHEFLSRDRFDSDVDYERALSQLATKISILPPVNENRLKPGVSRQHWTLQFSFNEEGKWLAALADIKDNANKNVRDIVKSRFDNLLSAAKQNRAFDLEDLDTQISMMIAAYDSETKRKVAHLTEQAAIARELGFSKQNSDGGSTSNTEAEPPLYLRGYDALEKEIELIKARQDKASFIEGLMPLEQKKLALSADRTLERAERLFALTPVMRSGAFQAATFDISATEFQYNGMRSKMLLLAAVVGGMIGVVFVLIVDALRSRKVGEAG